MREEWKKPLLEVIKILGITLAVYVILRFLLPMVIPFLIAALLAKLLHPAVDQLHRKLHLKKGLLAGMALLFFLAIVAMVLWFLGKSLTEQLHGLLVNRSVYQEQLVGIWDTCCCQVADWVGMEPDWLNRSITGSVPRVWEQVKGTLLPALIGGSFSWVKGLFVGVGILVIIGVSTLLILKDYDRFYEGMRETSLGRLTLNVLSRVYHAGGGYLKAQVVIMLVVSAVCVVGLLSVGNSYALLAGVGIGICDAMPFLGTGIVFIPWAILELLQGKYMLAAIYAVLYTVASLTRELLEPRLVGDKLGMPPLAVIISVYVGLCIFGLWGFALGPLAYILIREIRLELKGT